MSSRHRGWLAFSLGVLALLWSTALVLAAFVYPSYSGQGCQATPDGSVTCGNLSAETLFAVNGWSVVELLCGFVLVTAAAFWALHIRCSTGSESATTVAAFCIGGLGVFSVLSGFSIGLLVLPIVFLLVGSAALTPTPGARPGR